MTSSRGLNPQTRQEWIHFQHRATDRAVDLLAGLVEEHGAELALVRNVVGLVRNAGGLVALDALRYRLRARLSGDLSPEELATAVGDLAFRIRDSISGA